MQQQNNSLLGFDSAKDFIESLLGFKSLILNALIAFVAVLTQFITGYIWDSPSAIYTLWALMAADWITGIWVAKSLGKFNSKRLPRMLIYFIATSFLIAISWWLAKSSIIFIILPSLIYAGFCSVYLVSLIENFAKVGILPKKLEKFIKNKFGLEAIIEKYNKED